MTGSNALGRLRTLTRGSRCHRRIIACSVAYRWGWRWGSHTPMWTVISSKRSGRFDLAAMTSAIRPMSKSTVLLGRPQGSTLTMPSSTLNKSTTSLKDAGVSLTSVLLTTESECPPVLATNRFSGRGICIFTAVAEFRKPDLG